MRTLTRRLTARERGELKEKSISPQNRKKGAGCRHASLLQPLQVSGVRAATCCSLLLHSHLLPSFLLPLPISFRSAQSHTGRKREKSVVRSEREGRERERERGESDHGGGRGGRASLPETLSLSLSPLSPFPPSGFARTNERLRESHVQHLLSHLSFGEPI